eukprot:4254370-Amphidinium_carterae.1
MTSCCVTKKISQPFVPTQMGGFFPTTANVRESLFHCYLKGLIECSLTGTTTWNPKGIPSHRDSLQDHFPKPPNR